MEIEREKERKDRVEEKIEMENMRREMDAMKATKIEISLPFGLEPHKYLNADGRDAIYYLTTQIIPRVKFLIEDNMDKFKSFYELGKECEQTALVPKTCLIYNKGKDCREGFVHPDRSGMLRMHTCTVCWEVLWSHFRHRVVSCPMLTNKFWKSMEVKRLP